MSDSPPLDLGKLLAYKCNQLMAFCKPPTFPLQSAERTDFHQMAMAYAKRNLHLLHRLDQPASGVVLFARNAKAAAKVSKQIRDHKVDRTYFAVVSKKTPEKKGLLQNFLVKSRHSNKSRIIPDMQPGAHTAILSYEYIAQSDRYHLLKIKLDTGRHHQIRVQLAGIDCPIKGDVKYGSRRSNPDRSIHLHAYQISFQHPVSTEKISVTCDAPADALWDFFRPHMQ